VALAQYRTQSAGAYPGPSREELADLAEWVTDSDFQEPYVDRKDAPGPKRPTDVTPVHRADLTPYDGPTREELGDLAVWLDVDLSQERNNDVPSPPATTSLRAIEAELWVSERMPAGTQSSHRPEVVPHRIPRSPSSDPFLDQLDEIQEALRKRAC